jgi:tetratricopeptide (TPR) repeat protein
VLLGHSAAILAAPSGWKPALHLNHPARAVGSPLCYIQLVREVRIWGDGEGKMRMKGFFLGCLMMCLLPVFSVAQTSQEIQAEQDIQAGRQAQAQGEYALAAADYEAAVKLMPEVPELYGNLGIAYYLDRDYDKAIAAFQQALKRNPALEGPNLYLGMAYIKTAHFAEAIEPLQKALAANPGIREAYINLSGTYNELDEKEEALQVLQRAEKIFPNDEEILYSLGSLYYDLMFKAYTKMAEVAPHSYRYDQMLGKSYEERQEFSNAIIEYKMALKVNPQAPGLHYALGNVYWLSGHYDDAKPEFEAELQITPEDYLSTWKLGNIYLHKRDYDNALPLLQKAIDEHPTLGLAYRDMGKLYMQTNDNEHALECLKKVVQLDPNEPNPHFLLATTYRHMGNTAEAQAEMEQFQKLTEAQKERRRPADEILAGASEQKQDLKAVEEDEQPDIHQLP